MKKPITWKEWLQALRSASNLKLKSKIIDENFKTLKDNLLLVTMADTCLNVKFRKTNTIAELKSLLAKTKDSKAEFSLEIKE